MAGTRGKPGEAPRIVPTTEPAGCVNARRVMPSPICGEDFCDDCGDCLVCYGEDACDGGKHVPSERLREAAR